MTYHILTDFLFRLIIEHQYTITNEILKSETPLIQCQYGKE